MKKKKRKLKRSVSVSLLLIILVIIILFIFKCCDKKSSNSTNENKSNISSNTTSNISNSNMSSNDNSNSNISSNTNSDSNISSNNNSNKSNINSNSNNIKSNNNLSNNSNVNNSIVGKTSKGYEIKKIDGLYYIKGILVANKTYPLPSTYAPGDLLSEFTIAFTKMKNDAAKEGITLTVVSGYRSYTRQTTLYNNYVARDGKANADTYSARPGHSEHQTGLAADLNLVDTSFENTKAGKWLAQNCYKYGFILRYPKGKESITGYIYEPWHFRFIGDEAKNLYNDGSWISLEEYLGIDSKY